MTIAKLHELFLAFPEVCTDTRKITKNCLFFALKGANFNGAAYAIVDEDITPRSKQLIHVPHVLKALQALANYHRNYCNAKVIALTGSNGKTTTKELIHAVLSRSYSTIATIGNLNNHIGVPLTLLSIKPQTEIAIVEMGANHLKEIEFLCTLAEPDYGYITNFGKAHLEGFGGPEGVIAGKSELYHYLIANNKFIFLNADDPIQEEKLSRHTKKIGFSKHNHLYYIIGFLGANPFVQLEFEKHIINSQLIGKYNFTNCCAALIMGKYFNVPTDEISEAISSYVPENNRSQILNKNGHRIILDAYNANPTSMLAALENFKAIEADYKAVFLGDMFELGETAAEEHQKIADITQEMNFDHSYLIGANFEKTQTNDVLKFSSFELLKAYLSKHPLQKATLLIKGSRGMALERILALL